jgi:hypothetical protein
VISDGWDRGRALSRTARRGMRSKVSIPSADVRRHSQSLNCPGCRARFDSSSIFLRHLEEGDCSGITAAEFHSHLVHASFVCTISSAEGRKVLGAMLRKATAHLDDETGGGISLPESLIDSSGTRPARAGAQSTCGTLSSSATTVHLYACKTCLCRVDSGIR